MVNGFVNTDPGYAQTTLVLNPFSDVIREVFGPDIGAHARTAIGVASVPLNLVRRCRLAQLGRHPVGGRIDVLCQSEAHR
jgi:hypothetical protein